MPVSEVIRRSKGLEIMLALAKGPTCFSDLQRAVGGSATTVEERIAELLQEGIIREEKMSTAPFRRTLALTHRGSEVTSGLQGINGILDRQLSEKRQSVLASMISFLGEVKSRTRLEKLMFLLQAELNFVSEQPYNFVPYRLGPYSRELVKDIEVLRKLGVVEEDTVIHAPFSADGKEVVQYTYRIAMSAQGIAQLAYQNLGPDQQQKMEGLRKYNEMSLRKLLDYVHGKWKDMRVADGPE